MARYARLEGSSEDPRLRLIQSFAQQDETLFEQALETLLAERAARYQRLTVQGAIPLWESATEGCISIEGLALVALAESKGFRTRSEYLHIPSLARLPAPAQSGPIHWENVRA